MDIDGQPLVLPGHIGMIGASPVTKLDSSKVLLTTPAGSDVPAKLTAPQKTDDNVWKLTLIDASKTLNAKATGIRGNFLTVEYSGNNAEGAQLSAIVVRNGDYKTGELLAYGTIFAAAW